MKAYGNWILLKPSKGETSSGLITAALDEGEVLSSTDEELIGTTVFFDINRVIAKRTECWVIHSDHIFGVIE